jgi:hypothetical protein
MDLNVKLKGLKYNFRKLWGCFCKITVAWELSDLNDLFFYKKSMKYVHGFMDWVHAADSWVHKPSLNEGRPSGDLRSRSKRSRGIFPI